MFIKLTRSGGRTYAQLVESFRDEQGRPRQRTLATLGRIDETDGQVDSLLGGLLRAKGRSIDDTSVNAGQDPRLFAGEVSFLASVPVNCHRPSEADNRR